MVHSGRRRNRRRKKGSSSNNVENWTEEECLDAVRRYPIALITIPAAQQSEAVCLAAIKIDPYVAVHVKNDRMRLAMFIEAVKKDRHVLGNLLLGSTLDPIISLEACRNDIHVLDYITYIPREITLYVIGNLLVDKIAPLVAVGLSTSLITTVAEEYTHLLARAHFQMHKPWHVLWNVCETIKIAHQ